MIFRILLPVLFLVPQSWANRTETFSGIAKEKGKVVYTENHEVSFDGQGKVLSAKTVYVDPEGKTLGVLKSDFKDSLSLPEHVFYDERTKGSYGIRRTDSQVVLFNQDSGKSEQKIELTDEKDKNRVQIGCQGFNYFLKDKLDELKAAKKQPVLFMIPGDLSTYKFVLELVKENPDQTFDFKVKIESWLLRAFAPELEFKYDRKIDRIIWYKGISNIKSAAGKTMNVEIEYKY
jgi:hypothetical protein